MKIIPSPLPCMLITLVALASATLGLAACGSQQEDAVSVLHHFNRGNEAYRIEDYRRAIIHFTRALELDESSPDIQYNLGLAYYRSGNYEEAVSAFMAALKARPTMIDAHYNLALAHDRLFNADAAHTHYNIYRGMVVLRKDSKAAATPGAFWGSAAAIPAVGAFGGRAAGGSGGRAGGTMVNGAAAAGNLAGPRGSGKTPAALNRGGNRAGKPAARGRPIPRGNRGARSGLRSQGLRPGHKAGQGAANRPPPQLRRIGGSAATPAASAPRQNTQTPTGEQQKWWIQDRFNRTR